MSRLPPKIRNRIARTIAVVSLAMACVDTATAQIAESPPIYYPPNTRPVVAPQVVAPKAFVPPTRLESPPKPYLPPNSDAAAKIDRVQSAPLVAPRPESELTLKAAKTVGSKSTAAHLDVYHQTVAGEPRRSITSPIQPIPPANSHTTEDEPKLGRNDAPTANTNRAPHPAVDVNASAGSDNHVESATSQVSRRAFERLPVTKTTAVVTESRKTHRATNIATMGASLKGASLNPARSTSQADVSQAEMSSRIEPTSSINDYRIANAVTPPKPANNSQETQAKVRNANPTPTKSSQPTVAGGHDGYNMSQRAMGYQNEAACGPGCGGCALCASPFSPDPNYENAPFDPAWEWDVYDGKWFNCVQQPLINWGRGLYKPGPTPPSKDWFGRKNPINSSFLLYGDYRTAIAYNDAGGQDAAVWAHRLNLDFDFKWTATERLHAFWGPLDRGTFTRLQADDGRLQFTDEFDEDFDTLFFEGDLGYIWGGFTDQYAPFDLPFALGRFPLFFQNGVWFNEVIEGFAFTIPAQHLRVPTISNWELTWFFGFDDVANPAFGNDDDVANIYGMHGFWELCEGYLETGYAYLDDQTGAGLGFHSFGFSWSRRYFHRVSNAIRLLVNTGQAPNSGGRDTADGQLLLIENSWISQNPNYFVPYFNLFAGFGSPQSAARFADNVLVNTGINFETDALTGYPTLDASGRDAWGGAAGVNLLGPDFSWQWIVEFAWLQTFGNPNNRQAVADQYAIGTRYQIPLNYAWILRMDAMHGFLEEAEDLTGARVELRWKF